MQNLAPIAAVFVAVVAVLVVVAGKLSQPRFSSRALLNRSERRLFWILVKLAPRGWHVMSQVSYGEFLRCKSSRKFFSINAKRADFVLCDASFVPVAVIEYQGGGHYGNSRRSRTDAQRRDRQKRRALMEADVPMIEVPPEFNNDTVGELLASVIASRSDAKQRMKA
ncbi:Protein of unknown function [Aliiroseovarius crassostreae]|uniref:DUF2726 domain-containing protein n=1 Tax=Aliiroseovarius crassostreae TaxID=154981 RepID=A0A0N8IBE6_9RHOB|nr:DUF2726 domain-containing protein [Aliiroseovarius crassostreae]KPN62891.1 hypothetical protein AKJ29_01735 [Aliiroseovarius crassostreae]SFU98501.1 Protein of unknown function [Aliiroseovarius crassostreae]